MTDPYNAGRNRNEIRPNYEKDEETFERFLQGHTIQVVVDNNDNDDDSEDENDTMNDLPHRGSHRIQTRVCYPPLLQRIRDRHFYDATETTAGQQVSSMSNHTFVVEVPLQELVDWDTVVGADLALKAAQNTLRYHELFCNVIDRVLAALEPSRPLGERDTIDILHDQRVAASQRPTTQPPNNHPGGGLHHAGNLDEELHQEDNDNNNNNNRPDQITGATEAFPAPLMRRYELRILPMGRRGVLPPFVHQHLTAKTTTTPPPPMGASLRTIRSGSMGRLVTIRGMIVRSSDVKPCCVVATYSCDACGIEAYQVVQNRKEFMPANYCPSAACRSHKKGDTLHLQTRGSKFVKFQQLKLQELPHQVPMGHVPRSMTVYCRGELTRLACPGDVVTMDGIFLPQRIAESGYRAMKAGLVSTTFLEAQNIIVHKKSYDESLLDSLSPSESAKLDEQIEKVATGQDPVGKLSASIAPEIFGHEDIKRALLLQLVGGCTRKLPDGMRIRGDINICLMGDPGVAKSQLLKHVSSIAPRGVYTTGKGSSGVGLTAAVTKDTTTGEMTLEAGAMVLGDRGLVAIDEFDKMDESDRTAIHEVMEQQTVSIAKAGIVATLNARAAVLAAANPLYGRYNRFKSLSENINLPNSLLSRFDLMFLILDIADCDRDTALARHVTFVHQNEGLTQQKGDDDDEEEEDNDTNDNNLPTAGLSSDSRESRDPQDDDTTLPPTVLREYIARARQHHPVMPPDVAPYVVEAYVSLRNEHRPRPKKESDQTVMTARQLLSILRLSQALARLRFSDFVAREDVDEAIRLTHMSKATLLDQGHGNNATGGGGPGDATNNNNRREDAMSRVFNIIRDYATVSGTSQVELKLCEAMVLRKGFTVQQLQTCLEEYEALQVIQVNRTRTHVYFMDSS